MKLPKRQPRDNETLSDTVDSLLTACTVVLLLASLGGLTALFASLHIGLRVGDILVFKPDATRGRRPAGHRHTVRAPAPALRGRRDLHARPGGHGA